MKWLTSKAFKPKHLWYYAIGIILLWSFFVGFALLWQQKVLMDGAHEAARIEARESFQNHVIFRSWNAGHGGLYAPVTNETQPNPYLETPEKNITTPAGKELTKINPAFMTRQVNELAFEKFGYIAHITSLKPIRPKNKPDEWETKALTSFEQGLLEVNSIEIIHSKEYMRLMRPLIVEQGCLKCHAKQGYQQGDIRGGISVAVPMEPHMNVADQNITTLKWMYGLLWMTGVISTILLMSVLYRQIRRRLFVEDELVQHEKMEGVIEMARAVCHELNQPLQMILGNSEILLMEDLDEPDAKKRITQIKEQVDRMGIMTKKLITIANYETKEMPQGKVIDIDKSSK